MSNLYDPIQMKIIYAHKPFRKVQERVTVCLANIRKHHHIIYAHSSTVPPRDNNIIYHQSFGHSFYLYKDDLHDAYRT